MIGGRKKLDVSFILVEKEGDIRHVSNWKEGRDCYACQCSLKKSLKSCAEKQWRWTDKRQMQLKDRHDGDARCSETREKKIVLQGSWPNRRSVYTGRGQPVFFIFWSFSLCYGSRRARCEREQEPDLRLNHLWLFWSHSTGTQWYQEKLRKSRKGSSTISSIHLTCHLDKRIIEWERKVQTNPKDVCSLSKTNYKPPNNTHLPLNNTNRRKSKNHQQNSLACQL